MTQFLLLGAFFFLIKEQIINKQTTAWHIQNCLLRRECNHSAVGFRGVSSDFNLTHCNEIHIYFFSLVYLKKQTNKFQHISFLKVFISCCLTYIIIWKHKVTLYKYFVFFFFKALLPLLQHRTSRRDATKAGLLSSALLVIRLTATVCRTVSTSGQ